MPPVDPMNDTFLAFLATRGGNAGDGVVRDFGDAAAEATATASGSVLAHLGQFRMLEFRGAEARGFLHSQLSCDVEGLGDDRAAYGAYCTPKGRVLANFLLWREADAFRMVLRRSILGGIQKRLQMYVLRTKVTIAAPRDDPVILGAAGPAAPAAAASLTGTSPGEPLRLARRDGVTVIALAERRWLVTVPGTSAPQVWTRLESALRPVGTACWEWLEVAAGLPWIDTATQDQFVPQMANLELLGGVSFRKGCYPGQEIVARTQHLGRPKRRLYLAHVRTGRRPAPGEPLYGGAGGQAAGTVVNAAPAPGGGFDLLAVVQTATASAGAVRLGSESGAELQFRALPYPIP
jgi:hypothetical protein